MFLQLTCKIKLHVSSLNLCACNLMTKVSFAWCVQKELYFAPFIQRCADECSDETFRQTDLSLTAVSFQPTLLSRRVSKLRGVVDAHFCSTCTLPLKYFASNGLIRVGSRQRFQA